ncbi:enterobactin synthase subunit EntD [Superficieibacter electus]|uniref:Enterobactin synthase component D n=1 Tax=Superficieibacter electus TaxID=2022662 RepID=A0A2P5GQY2_9ENTR|nr:enterobactin synthase subunit EntD [Superficieibacter electus]POP43439.1 enterobactin synthase subunit EntD [Superficieibacter electus]POP48954.1 enterobactin synthase subunit EntD [Superficieibacter electus]
MHTTSTTFRLASHRLHRVDFLPDTFREHDLLWLPHHHQFTHAGRKRKAEHLAGRIAAMYALGEYGEKRVPGIGEQRQPLWPAGLYGSISHSETTALAVVSPRPVGVDLETLFTARLSDELADSIVDADEQALLRATSLPFPLALTVAFSAKESLFKARSTLALPLPGFHSARLMAFTTDTLALQLNPTFSPSLAGQCMTVHWTHIAQKIVTVSQ